jgi:hypothetical protein
LGVETFCQKEMSIVMATMVPAPPKNRKRPASPATRSKERIDFHEIQQTGKPIRSLEPLQRALYDRVIKRISKEQLRAAATSATTAVQLLLSMHPPAPHPDSAASLTTIPVTPPPPPTSPVTPDKDITPDKDNDNNTISSSDSNFSSSSCFSASSHSSTDATPPQRRFFVISSGSESIHLRCLSEMEEAEILLANLYIKHLGITGVEVRKSKLGAAGLGLFATREFFQGSIICPYFGVKYSNVDEDFIKTLQSMYVLKICKGHYIDGQDIKKAGPARYANDGGHIRNNACIAVCRKTKTASLQASKHIALDREILVSYGSAFWPRNFLKQ